jgi:tRNA (pseudouridine54-N1)-methyltransferase
MVRRFVVVGQKAIASEDFLLDDLPGTSGRLDVLVRCVRAAMLSSHGLRKDVIVYLVLLGGPRAPRVVRLDGAEVRFLRPDERSIAVLLKKVLASHVDDATAGGWAASPKLVQVRDGIAVARGGFDVVLADAPDATVFVLHEEMAEDIRDVTDLANALFVIGDHLGLPEDVLGLLPNDLQRRITVGPVSIHADDVVAIVQNELDRRGV